MFYIFCLNFSSEGVEDGPMYSSIMNKALPEME